MYCNHCGKEIDEMSIVCIFCGVPTGRPNPAAASSAGVSSKDPNEPARGGFIALAIFVPVAGVALAIMNFIDGKKRAGKAYLITAIVSAAVTVTLCVTIYLLLMFYLLTGF